MMLAAGGFVAAGDLSLIGVIVAAFVGAVSGDQLGYFIGRWGGARLMERLGSRAALLHKASALLAAKGGPAVFLSRWLVSALGPYVNVAAGASRQAWATFTIWGVLGEAIWVGVYIGLGDAFTGNLQAASSAVFNALGFLAAIAVAVALGAWLFKFSRKT